MKKPAISVVMPAYNAGKFLDESVQSILNQTFKDFEFIIVNDGSKDNTFKILKKYKDKRIKLINHKKNLGFAASLNAGLRLSRGKYIAACNSDDISHPKRLEIEFDYLENHPQIFLVGTSAIYINEMGKEIRRFRKYDDYKMLAWRMRKSCGIIYPSIMFRNEKGLFFDKKYGGAIDYRFYFNLIKKRKKLTNIPQFLVKFRVHPGSMSVYDRKQQAFLRDRIIEKFNEIPDPTSFLDKIHYSIKLFFHYIRTMREKKILL